MNGVPPPSKSVAADIRVETAGRVTLSLRGRLDAESTGKCWRELEHRLRPLRPAVLDVDASGLELQGGIGIALLRYLSEGGMTPGAQVNLLGLSDALHRLFDTFSEEGLEPGPPPPPLHVRVPAGIGAHFRAFCRDLREQVAFIGIIIAALPRALVRPKQMRWREVRRVMEVAGANALPVVGLLSSLVGIVTALEVARPLQQLGAQVLLGSMIGLAAIRDTGPLVTAIVLAGRSGSAFAAELGTMKVNDELDALRTMGLEPVRFLVLQRVVAALLLTPLLAVYAMLFGLAGGIMVMGLLGFPPLMVYHQITARVRLGDLGVGLYKSVAFGLIVGGVGCLRGLQTGQGPQAVGVSTTRSVVTSIVLVILADALFSTVDYFFFPYR